MLAKEYRLNSPRDFTRVKDLGTRINSKNFLFTYFKRKVETDGPSRFGIIVTTKLAPNATDRNRIKRVLSEATRHNLVFVDKGYDCVFLPRVEILRAYAADVMKEVKEVLDKANITHVQSST